MSACVCARARALCTIHLEQACYVHLRVLTCAGVYDTHACMSALVYMSEDGSTIDRL
jgi:hypothetical protein